MSQIFKPTSGGTPVIPPDVPELFPTDVRSPAIPAANMLNVFGGQTSVNNLLGIQTDGGNGSDTLTIQLTNRLQGGASTNDGSSHNIVTFALDVTPAVYTFDGFISAYNSSSIPVSGAGYFFSAAVRSDGVVATELGQEFTSVFEEAGMSPASVAIVVSGNNFIIQVTGIAGQNIAWLAQSTYSRNI